MNGVVIRERQPADLDECVRALRVVHEADAYPLNWPSDPSAWLTPPGLLTAWIAEGPGGTIDGHLAVHQAERPGPDAQLSRLFVTPAARRLSVATGVPVRTDLLEGCVPRRNRAGGHGSHPRRAAPGGDAAPGAGATTCGNTYLCAEYPYASARP